MAVAGQEAPARRVFPGVKPRLFLDEDIHFGLAQALRNRGHDVVHAQDAERKGRSDREQLAYAAEQGRCLLSFNVKDFVILHNEYAVSRRNHWGIIVSKQVPVGSGDAKDSSIPDRSFTRLCKKPAVLPRMTDHP